MRTSRTRVGTAIASAVALGAGLLGVAAGSGTAAAGTNDVAAPAAASVSAPLEGLSSDGKRCFGKKPTKGVTRGADPDGDFDRIIRGTSGPDVIIGTDGDDLILGRGGNDRICSKDGADDVGGGKDDDRIDAGPGDDLAVGDANLDSGDVRRPAGNDRILGGPGNDLLIGDHSTDDGSVFGDGGDDVLVDSGNVGVNTADLPFTGDQLVGDHFAGERGDVVGDGGDDRLRDKGATDLSTLPADPATELTLGTLFPNSFDFLTGDHIVTEGGNITGNGGNDRLRDDGGLRDDIVGDHVSRTENIPAASPGPPPVLAGPPFGGSIAGNGGNDIITKGGGFAQNLTGDHFGDRLVTGKGGDDAITGPDGIARALNFPGTSNDVAANVGTQFVLGDHFSNGQADSFGGGNDTINLGAGIDGAGTDGNSRRAVVAGDSFARNANNADGTAVGMEAANQARIIFGGGNDVINTGGGNEPLILGGEGNDTINAGDGDDRLGGGADIDTCDGGGGTDTEFGANSCETKTNIP